MSVFFSSDWHLNHHNIHKLRTFVTSEQHNEQMIIDSCKVLNKHSLLFLLGDIVFSDDGLKFISELPKCRKILIKGNHDIEDTQKLLTVFERVEGFIRYKNLWLSHCPIHPKELRSRFNVHGHVHYQTLDDERYLNVCPERSIVNFQSYLVNLDQVKNYFKGVSNEKT